MDKSAGAKKNGPQEANGIGKITVSGFKSIVSEQSIEIAPLTILAGANSSGKSSMMQPLLLMKQTLEATYDPGVFLLTGPNVKFTEWGQLLARDSEGKPCQKMSIGVELPGGSALTTTYLKTRSELQIEAMDVKLGPKDLHLMPQMSHEQLVSAVPDLEKVHGLLVKHSVERKLALKPQWMVAANRCFLSAELRDGDGPGKPLMGSFVPSYIFEPHIRGIIHLPGLRGNPERTYPRAAVGDTFPGAFQDYAASVVLKWQSDQRERIEELNEQLHRASPLGASRIRRSR